MSAIGTEMVDLTIEIDTASLSLLPTAVRTAMIAIGVQVGAAGGETETAAGTRTDDAAEAGAEAETGAEDKGDVCLRVDATRNKTKERHHKRGRFGCVKRERTPTDGTGGRAFPSAPSPLPLYPRFLGGGGEGRVCNN